MKKYIVFVFLLSYGVLLFGQEPVVVPLSQNPALHNRSSTMVKSDTPVDTVKLPFIDDFSYYSRSIQPDRKLWMDQYVYINNSYPVSPISNGVATFDALDANGNVYKSSTSSFPADTLTSNPIDLGATGLSNVYLSFFYQPQGYGDNPEPGDSLILQFKSPVSEQWRTIWHTEGTTTHPFKQVLFPVEGEYLRKGFQFRFVNLVSLEQDKFNLGRKGNADHWHIDYVRLDKNRSDTDTAILDISVVEPMKSLITGYQSMPWNQLQYAIATRLEPMVEITYRNNDIIDRLVNRIFTATDVYHNITNDLAHRGADNIDAGAVVTFKQEILNPFESTSVDSALFELKGYLETDQYDRKDNDTVRFYQFFKNYFARDDGTPESGYGFSGYNAQGCAVACRYETFMPDSLQAIKIFFNSTEDNISAQYRFQIAVWRDNSGRPGEQIYLSPTEYSPVKTGQFTQYNLGEAIYVTKYYWVGLVQVTSGFLNIGFDRNYNDKGNLWYNNGTWQQDINDGTLMIRPIMGKKKDFFTHAEQPDMSINSRMKIYPNPASQYVRIEVETSDSVIPSDYHIEIYAVNGRLRYRGSYSSDYIDLSGFESGLYIVRMIHRKTGILHIQKLMINR